MYQDWGILINLRKNPSQGAAKGGFKFSIAMVTTSLHVIFMQQQLRFIGKPGQLRSFGYRPCPTFLGY